MSKEEHFANTAPENAVALDCKMAGLMVHKQFLAEAEHDLYEAQEDVFQLEQMLDRFMRDEDTEALRRAYHYHMTGKEERNES